MNNAEWMIKHGYKFRELTWKRENTEKYDYDILLNNKCIGKVKDSYPSLVIQTWLDMEHIEPILDDTEKKYLSAVIKPFRDRVQCIVKVYAYNGYYIFIKFNDESHDMDFPVFTGENMYKGMKPYDKYTLEELGL